MSAIAFQHPNEYGFSKEAWNRLFKRCMIMKDMQVTYEKRIVSVFRAGILHVYRTSLSNILMYYVSEQNVPFVPFFNITPLGRQLLNF